MLPFRRCCIIMFKQQLEGKGNERRGEGRGEEGRGGGGGEGERVCMFSHV